MQTWTSFGASLPKEEGSSFLRRHRGFLTFFGALVVFATFIFKEVLRENLKDLVDSIDAAQGVFVVEEENQHISQRLSELFRLNTATYGNILAPPPGGVPQINVLAVELHWQATLDAVLRLENEFSSAKRLLKRIPHEKKYEDELNELKCRVDDASESYKEYIPPGSSSPQPEVQQSFFTIVDIEHRAWGIENDLQSLAESVLTDSIEQKEKDERYFKKATLWSYGLYALGWSLGLIGRLYGMEGITEEE